MKTRVRKISPVKANLNKVHRARVPEELFDEYELDIKIKQAKSTRRDERTDIIFSSIPAQAHEVFERMV
ncbi:MAG: hypothetical protein L0Y79_03765 [Chlorobi bacterium]|nr:hypothetical protein [Chlorobiota bacterium]MCI0715161.1 hypothetical protein [Chlorobiota bacterium]